MLVIGKERSAKKCVMIVQDMYRSSKTQYFPIRWDYINGQPVVLSYIYLEASVGQTLPWTIHPNVCFLILLICCWVVAASLMAEKTNVCLAVFVAGNTYMCVVSGRMELLLSFLRARLSAAAVISLSSPVLRSCFRALLHPVRSAARPSQDIVSMSTAFISLTQTS